MNLANKITMVRIFLTVLLIVLLLFPFYMVNIEFPKVLIGTISVDIKYFIAAGIFAIASITDAIDGHIARSRNMVTDFGKMTDAIADKMLVNSTPLGMRGKAMGVSPIEEDILKTLPSDAAVYDIVYNPLKTSFIKLAQKNDYRVITGLDMFVYQGAKAFEIWTGQKAKPEVMKMAALEELAV